MGSRFHRPTGRRFLAEVRRRVGGAEPLRPHAAEAEEFHDSELLVVDDFEGGVVDEALDGLFWVRLRLVLQSDAPEFGGGVFRWGARNRHRVGLWGIGLPVEFALGQFVGRLLSGLGGSGAQSLRTGPINA